MTDQQQIDNLTVFIASHVQRMKPRQLAEAIVTTGLFDSPDADVVSAHDRERRRALKERDTARANECRDLDVHWHYEEVVAELDRALATLQRVRELHYHDAGDGDDNRCYECWNEWPCPTIAILDDKGDTK